MAYDFYLDGVQLPIPPPKLEIKVPLLKMRLVDLM